MSLNSADHADVRVAYDPEFTPAGFQKGKRNNECLKFIGITNTYQGLNQDGTRRPDKVESHEYTIWGPMAGNTAKWLSQGRQLILIKSTPKTYPKGVFDKNRQPVCDENGNQYKVKGFTGYKVNQMARGDESAERIAKEVAARIRFEGWKVVDSAENKEWQKVRQYRQQLVFDCSDLNNLPAQFGHAKVVIPPGFQIDPTDYVVKDRELNAKIQKACFLQIPGLTRPVQNLGGAAPAPAPQESTPAPQAATTQLETTPQVDPVGVAQSLSPEMIPTTSIAGAMPAFSL